MKRRITLLFFLSMLFSFAHAQDKNLEKRIARFYEIEEDRSLNEHDKAIKLKEYILPGAQNDSMAHFFAKSWSRLNKDAKSLQTRVVNIIIKDDNKEAVVTIEDIVIYTWGERIVFTSKTIWVKENKIWYRSYKKSELYENGKRVR